MFFFDLALEWLHLRRRKGKGREFALLAQRSPSLASFAVGSMVVDSGGNARRSAFACLQGTEGRASEADLGQRLWQRGESKRIAGYLRDDPNIIALIPAAKWTFRLFERCSINGRRQVGRNGFMVESSRRFTGLSIRWLARH